MRLKTLFFPIMLVISVSIFIGYIWPEIIKLSESNGNKLTMNQEMLDINSKKNAIESARGQISSGDGEKIIKNYLPEKKVEERIISDINYLASSSNVSLIDISLESEKIGLEDGNKTPAGLPGVFNPLATAEAALATVGSGVSQKVSSIGKVKSTSTKISVSGEYEKIRIFINSLHRMTIFNKISSLSIVKQEVKTKEGEAPANENLLLANMVVDFGYMNIASVTGQQVTNFDSVIDSKTIDILKKYVAQSDYSLESASNVKGVINPFISN